MANYRRRPSLPTVARLVGTLDTDVNQSGEAVSDSGLVQVSEEAVRAFKQYHKAVVSKTALGKSTLTNGRERKHKSV